MAKQKFEIPPEPLKLYYIEENHTKQECALFFGTPIGTVSRCIKKYGLRKSRKDVYETLKRTCLKRYGTEYVSQTSSFKEKVRNTFQTKYGVNGTLGLPSVKQTIKENTIKKYGADHHMKTKLGKQQYCNTMVQKYGVENASQSSVIQEKKEVTTFEHFGVRNPSQSESVKKKKQATNIEHFGVSCNLTLEETREQIRNTCIAKYGTPCPPIQKYIMDNQTFDSSWEISLYIYAKDHGEEIQRCPTHIPYEYKGKKHYTIPDFLYKGQLIEIKGDQFFEGGSLINLYNREEDGLAQAKYLAALEHGVTFWFNKDIQFAIDYVKATYPAGFLEQYRR